VGQEGSAGEREGGGRGGRREGKEGESVSERRRGAGTLSRTKLDEFNEKERRVGRTRLARHGKLDPPPPHLPRRSLVPPHLLLPPARRFALPQAARVEHEREVDRVERAELRGDWVRAQRRGARAQAVEPDARGRCGALGRQAVRVGVRGRRGGGCRGGRRRRRERARLVEHRVHKDLLGEEPRAGRLRERDGARLWVRVRRVGRAAEVVRADARDERGRELRGVVGEGGGGGELRARGRRVSLRAERGEREATMIERRGGEGGRGESEDARRASAQR